MITLQVLNSDSTLNSFFIYTNSSFIAGEDVLVRLRLLQVEKKIRYIPDIASTITFDLKKSDNTTLSKTATFPFADDRSIIEFTITAAESVDVISQTLVATIDEPAGISIAKLQYGLKKNVIDQGC